MNARSGLMAVALACAACSFEPPGLCSSDLQCGAGLSCKSGVCSGCSSDGECNAWESCYAPQHRCTALAGKCSLDADCAAGLVCGADHTCTGKSCASAVDCAIWQSCGSNNTCTLLSGRCNGPTDCTQSGYICDAYHYCTNGTVDEGGGGDPGVGSGGGGLGGIALWGALTDEGPAVCPISAPQAPLMGFQNLDSNVPVHLDPQGNLVYAEFSGSVLTIRRFVPDAPVYDASAQTYRYPSSTDANDPVLATPSCANGGVPSNFIVQQTSGAILYDCGGNYYDVHGNKRFSGVDIISLNQNGLALVGFNPFYVVDGQGQQTQVTNFDRTIFVARAHSDGFWISDGIALFQINSKGVATGVGSYAADPSGFHTDALRLALDSSGALYTDGRDNADTYDVIIRHPLEPGSSSIAWSNRNAPADDWTVPRLFMRGFYQILSTP